MRTTTKLRRAASAVRTWSGPATAGLARLTVPAAGALALVASALVAGATFALAMELLPTTIPTLMAGWVAAIGLTVALPLVVVRGVVAALKRLQ